MTDRPHLRPVVTLAVLVAVVAAVLLLRPGGDDQRAQREADTSRSSTPPTPEPTIGAEEFCASYATMATAYGEASGVTADEVAVDRLETTTDEFLAVGVGPGMGPLEVAGRERFVTDILSAVGLATSDGGATATEELEAFSRYLSSTCPGY